MKFLEKEIDFGDLVPCQESGNLGFTTGVVVGLLYFETQNENAVRVSCSTCDAPVVLQALRQCGLTFHHWSVDEETVCFSNVEEGLFEDDDFEDL